MCDYVCDGIHNNIYPHSITHCREAWEDRFQDHTLSLTIDSSIQISDARLLNVWYRYLAPSQSFYQFRIPQQCSAECVMCKLYNGKHAVSPTFVKDVLPTFGEFGVKL